MGPKGFRGLRVKWWWSRGLGFGGLRFKWLEIRVCRV